MPAALVATGPSCHDWERRRLAGILRCDAAERECRQESAGGPWERWWLACMSEPLVCLLAEVESLQPSSGATGSAGVPPGY